MLEQQYYTLTLAGTTLRCYFEFPETAKFFGKYAAGPFPGTADVRVPSWHWERFLKDNGIRDPHSEYSLLSAACSAALLPHRRCVIHAAAMRIEDRAYLITAPSGVGKSTRLKALQKEYPGEFTVISGDRPILEACEDGTVLVHPSPWNGKEDWYGAGTAPLAGTIMLERGEEDMISRSSSKDAAARLFGALFLMAESADELLLAASIETAILNAAPAWQMISHEIVPSVRLLYNTVLKGGSTNELQTT